MNVLIIVARRLTGVIIAASLSAVSVGGQSLSVNATRLTISPYQLPFYMRGHAKVLGNRLFEPGNERVTLIGTITTPGQATTPITVLYDISGNVRIDHAGHSVGFDGNTVWAVGNRDQADNDLLESIATDSAEHFFQSQAQRLATRLLGRAFRFDDGKAQNYSGPYYDVFAVSDVNINSKQPQLRLFCVNSRTYLLERVQADTVQSGHKSRIETVLSGWQQFGSQSIPTSIARYQDGQQIFALTVTNAITAPTAQDGRLNAPTP